MADNDKISKQAMAVGLWKQLKTAPSGCSPMAEASSRKRKIPEFDSQIGELSLLAKWKGSAGMFENVPGSNPGNPTKNYPQGEDLS